MEHNQQHAGAHTHQLHRKHRRKRVSRRESRRKEEAAEPHGEDKDRGTHEPAEGLGICGIAAAGKGNPIPFRPGSRAPTHRDIAKHRRRALVAGTETCTAETPQRLHRRQAPTCSCCTHPKHQTSPGGASKEDTTHLAPPPPIPCRDSSFRPGSMAGVRRRAHGCDSREQNDAKGRRRRRVGNTNRGFPGLVQHHQLGEHPAGTGSGGQRPQIRRIQRRERAERGGKPVLPIWSRGGEPRRAATTARQVLAARAAEGAGPHLPRAPPAERRRRLTDRAAAQASVVLR